MTIDEAIEKFEKFQRHEHGSLRNLGYTESFELALEALREKAERDKGCEYCKEEEAMAYGRDSMRRSAYIYLDGNLLTADLYSDCMAVAICFCPMCGRKLEED